MTNQNGLSEERLRELVTIAPTLGASNWKVTVMARELLDLRAERDRLQKSEACANALRARAAAAEAERDAAREALRKYGVHDDHCETGADFPDECTCGLRAALGEQP